MASQRSGVQPGLGHLAGDTGITTTSFPAPIHLAESKDHQFKMHDRAKKHLLLYPDSVGSSDAGEYLQFAALTMDKAQGPKRGVHSMYRSYGFVSTTPAAP